MSTPSDMISVTVTPTSPGLIQTGFGVPLVLSGTAAFPERTRTYRDIPGVATDWATTSAEYKTLTSIFSQNPRPDKAVVGRLANKPTQRRTLTPIVFNSAVYKVRVNATTVSFTSDSSATAAEIVTGLIALVNAIAGVTLTASGTSTLVLTENTAGGWSDVEIDPTYFSLIQDHADPGVAADLDAIRVEDDSWYGIANPFPSKAMVLAIAAWAEANAKFYPAGSQDSDIILTVASGGTDVASAVKAAAYTKTAVAYHPSAGSFIGAAWMARKLPFQPGQETWAFTPDMVGVPATKLTATQITNALDKNANVYVSVAGRAVFITRKDGKGGTTGSGQFIDVSRIIDWVKARVGERVFNAISGAPTKVSMDDEGIATVVGQLESVLSEGVTNKAFRSYTMGPVPKADSISSADRTARDLENITAIANLAGAVHTAGLSISVQA